MASRSTNGSSFGPSSTDHGAGGVENHPTRRLGDVLEHDLTEITQPAAPRVQPRRASPYSRLNPLFRSEIRTVTMPAASTV